MPCLYIKGRWWRDCLASIVLILALLTIIFLSGCNHTQKKVLDTGSKENQAGANTLQPNDVLPAGTAVDDLDIGNLKVSEVSHKINSWAKGRLEQTRVLVYNETEVPVSLKDLGVDVDMEKTMANVKAKPGSRVASVVKINPDKAKKTLATKFKHLSKLPRDASFTIQDDHYIINDAVPGLTVNVAKTLDEIKNLPLKDMPAKLYITLKEVLPSVTTETIKKQAFDAVIGEFTTNFSLDDGNRAANLARAAQAIDQKVLRPGEVFSFNDVVGERTPASGYKDAYVIINNEYVQGTGGGVCQVSSTLYNAVLLANLQVLERMPHAVAVSYVPLGQDATVNYPDIDLKFKNNTDGVVYIRTQVKAGALTIKLYGKKTDKSVRIVRQVEKEIDYQTERRPDPKLSPGKIIQEQTGTKGYIVKTWRVVTSQGQETAQFLSRDEYKPANRILRIGIRGTKD